MNFPISLSGKCVLAGSLAAVMAAGLSSCGSLSGSKGLPPATAAQGASAMPAPMQIAPEKQLVEHVIQQGDSLWKLARDYDTTVNEIKTANNLQSDVIMAGKTLMIPTLKVPEGAATQPMPPATPEAGDGGFQPQGGGFQSGAVIPGSNPYDASGGAAEPVLPSASLTPDTRTPMPLAPAGFSPAPFNPNGSGQF